MRISAAGLIVEIEPLYDMLLSRLTPFRCDGAKKANIIIHLEKEYFLKKQERLPHLTVEECEYIYTGDAFYRELLRHDGFLLHASAVALNGKAFLFSAPSGTGKSTHTHLWLDYFKEKAKIINDDKPAIRLIDGEFFACGTPWSGKTDESVNEQIPLKAIAYIIRSKENHIIKAMPQSAVKHILDQTLRPAGRESMERLLTLLDKLLTKVNVYELYCDISAEAVKTAYEMMDD